MKRKENTDVWLVQDKNDVWWVAVRYFEDRKYKLRHAVNGKTSNGSYDIVFVQDKQPRVLKLMDYALFNSNGDICVKTNFTHFKHKHPFTAAPWFPIRRYIAPESQERHWTD